MSGARSGWLLARTQVLVAGVCFGTAGTAQALGPHSTTPLTVGAVRICVAAVLLGFLARTSWDRRALRGSVLLAGCGLTCYQLAFFAAVKLTGVVVGTMAEIGSGVLLVGLLSRLINGEHLSARWAVATALTLGGIGLLAAGFGPGATLDAAGVPLAMLAGAGSAVYAVMSKRALTAGLTPEAAMAGAFGAGAVLMLPLLAAGRHDWLATPGGAALALYLGVVTTAFAYLVYAHGLRRLHAVEAATLAAAEPITATLLGILVLAERPGPLGVAGMLLAAAGIVVLVAPRRMRRRVTRRGSAAGR